MPCVLCMVFPVYENTKNIIDNWNLVRMLWKFHNHDWIIHWAWMRVIWAKPLQFLNEFRKSKWQRYEYGMLRWIGTIELIVRWVELRSYHNNAESEMFNGKFGCVCVCVFDLKIRAWALIQFCSFVSRMPSYYYSSKNFKLLLTFILIIALCLSILSKVNTTQNRIRCAP